MQKKVLVAMSGGVDSSATAAILCQKGYDCIGVTMKLYNLPDDAVRSNTCCTLSDAEDAKSVAYRLGMRYYVMNFTADFAKEVIDRFVSAYERGETPNPCIDCNRYMKFEQLYQRAALLGCDAIATGHYARIAYNAERGRWLLKKSKNEAKDQSYVLYSMTQEQLAQVTGINQANISRLENGTANPSLRTLKRLAEGMGMELKLEFVPRVQPQH